MEDMKDMEDINEKLLTAAESGSTDEVVACLQRGADINYKGSFGQTALHLAALMGHDRMVEILVEGGGYINAKDYKGETALHWAARWGRDRSVEILVEGGGDINVQDNEGKTALHWAALMGQDRMVEILFGGGWDINVQDKWDMTALHRTAGGGHDRIIEILVEGGGDINVQDREGSSPLDFASNTFKKKMMTLAKSTEKKLKAAFPKITDTKEFQQLLSKGFYFSYNNRVYLAGACNVGKSTLASLLIGEAISKKWVSTDGLKIYFGKNGIHLKKKEMIVISKALQDSSILANVLLGQPSLDQTLEGIGKKGVLNVLKSIFKRTPHKPIESDSTKIQSPKVMASEMSTTSEEVSKETSNKSFQSSQVMTQKVSTDDVRHHQHSLKSKKQSHTGIHKDLTKEIKSGKYKVQIAPSDLVDFGGQKAFDLTHQLFIQQKGAFVLLIDGRKNLDDVLSEYPDGQMTTRSILLHWVNSILTYCSADNDDIYPLIVFALTHKDQLSKEQQHMKSKDITRQLTDMFSTHEYCDRIRFQQLFLINATDNNDSGVKSLKEFLVSVAFQQKSWGEKMPMAWVPLELQLAEMRANNIFIISKDDLCDLNMNNDDLSLSDKQLAHFLRCQHSLGKLMYFDVHALDQFIIVQPTAMVDILRSFITDEIFWPGNPSLKCILRTASEKGLIKKTHLLELWTQDEFDKYFQNFEMKEFVCQVLVHLDILVEPKRLPKPDGNLTDDFIVPCLIRRSIQDNQLPYNLDGIKTIVLSYKLLKTTIPNALAYKLIGAVLNIWPLKTKNGLLYLFDKAAVLEIDQTNELYITFRENRLIVGLFNNRLKNYISPEIASIIQECLTLTITNVLEFYFTSFGKSASCTDISKVFDIEFGEKCGNEICFISISDVHKKSFWNCKNNKEHRFPLYWDFDQTQDMCSTDCSGLDTVVMNDVPDDKHLIRLAKHIGREFDNFVIYLGLSKVEWDEIKDDSAIGKMLSRKFVGLCEWKMKKKARNVSPTFSDLAKALAYIEYNEHFLCLIFRERFTEVFAMDNPRLQDTPDDSVLQELSRNIGNQTLHLGVELEIDRISIEETQLRFSKDMYAQTYDILIKWKTTSKVKPTVRALMLALQYVDSRGFHFLQKHYGVEERTN